MSSTFFDIILLRYEYIAPLDSRFVLPLVGTLSNTGMYICFDIRFILSEQFVDTDFTRDFVSFTSSDTTSTFDLMSYTSFERILKYSFCTYNPNLLVRLSSQAYTPLSFIFVFSGL